MKRGTRAAEQLRVGDLVLGLAARDGLTHAAAGARLGFSYSFSLKAAWLSKAYSDEERAGIGQAALSVLTTSHLESVAALPVPERRQLLRDATEGSLSVRALREAACLGRAATGSTYGRSDDFARARKALERYLDMRPSEIARLLGGPAGEEIMSLARAGAALLERAAGRAA